MFRLRIDLLHKREPKEHRLVRPHPLRRERARGEDGRVCAPQIFDHRRVAARDASAGRGDTVAAPIARSALPPPPTRRPVVGKVRGERFSCTE